MAVKIARCTWYNRGILIFRAADMIDRISWLILGRRANRNGLTVMRFIDIGRTTALLILAGSIAACSSPQVSDSLYRDSQVGSSKNVVRCRELRNVPDS